MLKLGKLFWKYVTISGLDDCWLWCGSVQSNGYGRFGSGQATVSSLPHRVSFRLTRGYLTKGLCVCHRCDNPLCVNPTHLFEGTHKQNELDKFEKGRTVYGSRHGISKITEGDVAEIRNSPQLFKDIAAAYGLSVMQVSNIKHGKVWKSVGGAVLPERRRSKLTELEVLSIRSDTRPVGVIAKQYRVSSPLVSSIKSRRIWKNI